ncbi:hypothetical protein MUP00_09640, partial [Candidatus Bathyarchaeota archaeon]|nr:hypothetical protein [Candidatus Bathyarchaeota archaeon]
PAASANPRSLLASSVFYLCFVTKETDYYPPKRMGRSTDPSLALGDMREDDAELYSVIRGCYQPRAERPFASFARNPADYDTSTS